MMVHRIITKDAKREIEEVRGPGTEDIVDTYRG